MVIKITDISRSSITTMNAGSIYLPILPIILALTLTTCILVTMPTLALFSLPAIVLIMVASVTPMVAIPMVVLGKVKGTKFKAKVRVVK
jgi:uncharacterized integral membrane protein